MHQDAGDVNACRAHQVTKVSRSRLTSDQTSQPRRIRLIASHYNVVTSRRQISQLHLHLQHQHLNLQIEILSSSTVFQLYQLPSTLSADPSDRQHAFANVDIQMGWSK
jgi:hypothetical protein